MQHTGQGFVHIVFERCMLVRQGIHQRFGKLPLAGKPGTDLGITVAQRTPLGFHPRHVERGHDGVQLAHFFRHTQVHQQLTHGVHQTCGVGHGLVLFDTGGQRTGHFGCIKAVPPELLQVDAGNGGKRGADRCGVHQAPDLVQAQNGQSLGNTPQPAGRGWHPAIGMPHQSHGQRRVVADQLANLAQIGLVVAQLRMQKHQHFGNARQGILASQQCVQLHR